ncbi:DUF4238 domain-containing protein [Shewanella japonica]|uniref:DUF4238 domain-containing protein n=1 Tax=Shewanella japonica TaxID=93973 RepID=A0ABN4YIB9_9GAMM|nr:DUF4238 domain-containing protein [Shewanella japonica]ARD22989.1 hypothetical protein SJ2017_2703 [Shewanella japonica]
MGRQAGHHYIPASYLAGFTEGETKESIFWSIPIDNKKPFQTSPIKSCKKRDYYTIEHENSLLVEHWYANEIEPKIKQALEYISLHKTLPPKDEMQYLLLLAATLYLRTPSSRSTREAPLKRTQEIVDSIDKDVNISNRDAFKFNQTDLITSELKLISTVMECLSNKYYCLLISDDPNTNFITSDCPFLLMHPNSKVQYYGLNTKDIELSIPISKNAVLVGRNEEMKEGVFEANKKFVAAFNSNLITFTDKFFYSNQSKFYLLDDNGAPIVWDINNFERSNAL